MRPVSKGYLACVGCLGTAALVWSGWSFFVRQSPQWNSDTLWTLLLLLFLSWVCSCLPLYIRDDCTVDLSFLSILTSTLLLGPEAAVLVSAISFPFVVVSTPTGAPSSQLLEELEDYFEARREIAVDLQVRAPAMKEVAVSVQVAAAANKEAGQVYAAVEAALRSWFDGRRLGENVLRVKLGDLIYAVEGVENYQILSPAADVAVAADELPQLSSLTVEGMA